MSESSGWRWPPRTILVAVDFGNASARALGIAGALGAEFGARIRAIHAERFDPPPYFTLEQMARLEEGRRSAHAAALEHLAAFARTSGAAGLEPVVKDDSPVDAILEEAAGADLLVMGTHGRRGPGRWWLGSVAERVVRAASVPVLVTRASEEPVRGLFARVAVVRDPAGAANARELAEGLARLEGGQVIEGGTTAACATDTVHAATLLVVAQGPERPWSFLNDATARVLTSCSAPVLFVPGASR